MNIKIKYLNIERYETKEFEKYLEEMALKGWKLAYLSRRLLRFSKSEKTNIKYSVRILDKLSTFEGADPKKIDELKKTYEEAGWSFITEDNRLFIFATDNISVIAPCDKTLKEELIYNSTKSLKGITLNDFNRSAEHNYYLNNKNNLILKSISYAEKTNNCYLYYDYIEVKYNFLVKKCYEATINDFKSSLSEYHNDGMPCNFEEMKNLPNGMQGVKLSAISSNSLIFNLDNKILSISPT